MCLIAVKTSPNETFHYSAFQTAAKRNSDGTGIMYPKDGRIIHRKLGGKLSDEENKSLYDEFIAQPKAALHVRFTTHGKTDNDNAHPFEILSIDKGDPVDLFLMHNGVISGAPKVKEGMSDTWHFVEFMLKPMLKADPYAVVNPYIKAMIKDFIGACRLTFMYGDGTVVLVEDNQCNRDPQYGGVWLSNRSYLTPSYTAPNQYSRNSASQDYTPSRQRGNYGYSRDDDYSTANKGGSTGKVDDTPCQNKTTETKEVPTSDKKTEGVGGASDKGTPSSQSVNSSATTTGTQGKAINKANLPSEVISKISSLMLDATTLHDVLEILAYQTNDDIETVVTHDAALAIEIFEMIKELYEDGRWLKDQEEYYGH